jgi:hypothetical protein
MKEDLFDTQEFGRNRVHSFPFVNIENGEPELAPCRSASCASWTENEKIGNMTSQIEIPSL